MSLLYCAGRMVICRSTLLTKIWKQIAYSKELKIGRRVRHFSASKHTGFRLRLHPPRVLWRFLLLIPEVLVLSLFHIHSRASLLGVSLKGIISGDFCRAPSRKKPLIRLFSHLLSERKQRKSFYQKFFSSLKNHSHADPLQALKNVTHATAAIHYNMNLLPSSAPLSLQPNHQWYNLIQLLDSITQQVQGSVKS